MSSAFGWNVTDADAARDRQSMRHVSRHFVAVQRPQLIADRHALIELAHLRRLEQRVQIQLADQHDLQQLVLVGFEIRQDANLLEHRHRQVLRLVDDEHRARAQRQQAEQKVVDRLDELLLADVRQAPALDVFARDHAEVLQDELQQILFRQKRVQHERRERVPVDLFEQRAAERRLAGADVARDDDKPFAAADGVLQQLERVRVRLALEEKFGSGVRLNGFSVNP